MARELGADARAIAEGIRNDQKHPEKYALQRGDDCTVGHCPICHSKERIVAVVFANLMLVYCKKCSSPDYVETPRASRR